MFAGIRSSLYKLGTDFIRRSPPDTAVGLWRRLVAHFTRRYGPDDARTLTSRVHYAVALHRNGKIGLAESELAAVIERAEGTAAGADQAFIASAMAWHAKTLFDLRRFADAGQKWRAVALVREQLHGSNHPGTLGAHAGHAAALVRLEWPGRPRLR